MRRKHRATVRADRNRTRIGVIGAGVVAVDDRVVSSGSRVNVNHINTAGGGVGAERIETVAVGADDRAGNAGNAVEQGNAGNEGVGGNIENVQVVRRARRTTNAAHDIEARTVGGRQHGAGLCGGMEGQGKGREQSSRTDRDVRRIEQQRPVPVARLQGAPGEFTIERNLFLAGEFEEAAVAAIDAAIDAHYRAGAHVQGIVGDD